MVIGVKVALDNAIVVCQKHISEAAKSAESLIANDIYSFICRTSTCKHEERFDYFSKLYLKGSFKSTQFQNVSFSELPESLMVCFLTSNYSQPAKQISDAKIILAFFAELGNYYLSDRLAQRNTNRTVLIDLLAQMRIFIDKYEEEYRQIKNQSERPAKTNKKIIETQSLHKDLKENVPQEEAVLPGESLEELLDKLNSLIGLAEVKKEVQTITNLIKLQKKREELGIKQAPLSLHLVFTGNPGTGKTTVARILSKIYKRLGVLSKGQMIEVDRSGLVAGYVGQTEAKTQELITQAIGGILFIDEAYALTEGKEGNDFGQDAVNTLLKAMEDHRDDFIVIVAGYPDLMRRFIASNPGLRSRFNRYIHFEDYSPDELYKIFLLLCKEQNLVLDFGCDTFLVEYFTQMYNTKNEDFANGRDVRNYYENVVTAMGNRLGPIIESASKNDLLTIKLEDLLDAKDSFQGI